MIYIPDNHDSYIVQESEQERLDKLQKRFEAELNKDNDLPWVTIPDDYCQNKELIKEDC